MPTASATSGGHPLPPAAGRSAFMFSMGAPAQGDLWELEHVCAALADNQGTDAELIIGVRGAPEVGEPLHTNEIRAGAVNVGAAKTVYTNFARPLRYTHGQYVIVEVRVDTVVNGGEPTVSIQADRYPLNERTRRHHHTV